MPFVIVLNDIRGVELVTKALRETNRIDGRQLADGIENTVQYVDDITFETTKPAAPGGPLTVIDGGKSKH